MTDLTPDHPAVEAVERAAREWIADTTGKAPSGPAYMLSIALPHLTADDLRDTPAGQALIAEGRGWTPTTERDRRAHAILNDPTVPETTRHTLANAMRFLHKYGKKNGQ